jgi:hypothetical protein
VCGPDQRKRAPRCRTRARIGRGSPAQDTGSAGERGNTPIGALAAAVVCSVCVGETCDQQAAELGRSRSRAGPLACQRPFHELPVVIDQPGKQPQVHNRAIARGRKVDNLAHGSSVFVSSDDEGTWRDLAGVAGLVQEGPEVAGLILVMAKRALSNSSSGMSKTAKTEMPSSGWPSSDQARAVRRAWRASLSGLPAAARPREHHPARPPPHRGLMTAASASQGPADCREPDR